MENENIGTRTGAAGFLWGTLGYLLGDEAGRHLGQTQRWICVAVVVAGAFWLAAPYLAFLARQAGDRMSKAAWERLKSLWEMRAFGEIRQFLTPFLLLLAVIGAAVGMTAFGMYQYLTPSEQMVIELPNQALAPAFRDEDNREQSQSPAPVDTSTPGVSDELKSMIHKVEAELAGKELASLDKVLPGSGPRSERVERLIAERDKAVAELESLKTSSQKTADGILSMRDKAEVGYAHGVHWRLLDVKGVNWKLIGLGVAESQLNALVSISKDSDDAYWLGMWSQHKESINNLSIMFGYFPDRLLDGDLSASRPQKQYDGMSPERNKALNQVDYFLEKVRDEIKKQEALTPQPATP